MSLSRSEAEGLGLGFSIEDERAPSDPDQPLFQAMITRDDRTINFTGKSEEQVLEEVEKFLRGRGELGRDEPEAVEQKSVFESQSVDDLADGPVAESDVHDVRDEDDELQQPDGGSES